MELKAVVKSIPAPAGDEDAEKRRPDDGEETGLVWWGSAGRAPAAWAGQGHDADLEMFADPGEDGIEGGTYRLRQSPA